MEVFFDIARRQPRDNLLSGMSKGGAYLSGDDAWLTSRSTDSAPRDSLQELARARFEPRYWDSGMARRCLRAEHTPGAGRAQKLEATIRYKQAAARNPGYFRPQDVGRTARRVSLTEAQLDHYRRHGYVVVEGGLDATDLAPVIRDYDAFIGAQAANLVESGTLIEAHAAESFERRLARLGEEDVSVYEQIDLMYCRLRGVFEFLRNPNLLDLVESVVGPEIARSPIQHARARLPASLLEDRRIPKDQRDRLRPFVGENVAPWHQDAQVHLEVADPVPIVTVWVPLVDATPDNGCLQVIDGAHGDQVIYWSDGFGVSGENLPPGKVVTLPMDAGDVLLMDKLIPHRSTPNRTDGIRWSLDLRYQRTGTPTGRDFYPVFTARSRAHPASELRDYETWRRDWEQAVAAIPPPGRPRRQDRPTRPEAVRILP